MNKSIDLKTGTLYLDLDRKLDRLIGFAARENKKRGFLFVSKVLGKHIPSKPSEMDIVHKELSEKLLKKINDKPTVVIGFAETATGIGNGIYEHLNLPNSFYIYTTRYNLSYPRLVEFHEEHSHATAHILYDINNPELKKILLNAENIVLVDDEISTGKTLVNIIQQLKKSFPDIKNYYCVSVLNWMNSYPEGIEFISLHKGTFSFINKDFIIENPAKSVTEKKVFFDENLPYNFGRFGIKKLDIDYKKLVDIKSLKDKKVLVVGTGEFMYPPFLLARFLEEHSIDVYVQSTTRSPINVEQDIYSKITFKDNYGEDIDNFLYNVTDKKYDQIIICYESIRKVNNGHLKNILSEYFENITEIYFENKETVF